MAEEKIVKVKKKGRMNCKQNQKINVRLGIQKIEVQCILHSLKNDVFECVQDPKLKFTVNTHGEIVHCDYDPSLVGQQITPIVSPI